MVLRAPQRPGFCVLELFAIFGEDCVKLGIVRFGQEWRRLFEQSRFEKCAKLEQLLDFLRRGAGDDGALMGLHLHQALGLEQNEGFAEGNAAYAQFLGENRLAQLHAGRILALKDPAPQFVGGGRGARRRHDHSLGGGCGHDLPV